MDSYVKMYVGIMLFGMILMGLGMLGKFIIWIMGVL
ncbi:hypothetical protein [Salmonella phage SSBI34]|nr:hypothetical protein [Salmonella phage SSBI34]